MLGTTALAAFASALVIVFAVSAATRIVMSMSQDDDPGRFAAAARVHVAAHVLLVPLLTAAFANILSSDSGPDRDRT